MPSLRRFAPTRETVMPSEVAISLSDSLPRRAVFSGVQLDRRLFGVTHGVSACKARPMSLKKSPRTRRRNGRGGRTRFRGSGDDGESAAPHFTVVRLNAQDGTPQAHWRASCGTGGTVAAETGIGQSKGILARNPRPARKTLAISLPDPPRRHLVPEKTPGTKTSFLLVSTGGHGLNPNVRRDPGRGVRTPWQTVRR